MGDKPSTTVHGQDTNPARESLQLGGRGNSWDRVAACVVVVCGHFTAVRSHTWSYKVMHGHPWLRMVMHGGEWSCVVLQLCTVIYGFTWSCVVVCGHG